MPGVPSYDRLEPSLRLTERANLDRWLHGSPPSSCSPAATPPLGPAPGAPGSGTSRQHRHPAHHADVLLAYFLGQLLRLDRLKPESVHHPHHLSGGFIPVNPLFRELGADSVQRPPHARGPLHAQCVGGAVSPFRQDHPGVAQQRERKPLRGTDRVLGAPGISPPVVLGDECPPSPASRRPRGRFPSPPAPRRRRGRPRRDRSGGAARGPNRSALPHPAPTRRSASTGAPSSAPGIRRVRAAKKTPGQPRARSADGRITAPMPHGSARIRSSSPSSCARSTRA